MLAVPAYGVSDAESTEETYSATYDTLMDVLNEGDAVTYINDKLWVPWYSTSSSCTVSDLQSGSACDAYVDGTHHCMVSDEFSQVGVLTAMGSDEARMDAFYNTVLEIPSAFGKLPSWRVYRNGDTIETCKDGINSNCDSASDASARIVIALFTASGNDLFSQEARQRYHDLGSELAADMLQHEIVKECHQTRHGDVCHWLAGGGHAAKGGMASDAFVYTGYFPDAIMAMRIACDATGQQEYCQAARDISLNYLQAARWDGSSFRTPPGMSFRWTIQDGMPEAECTNNCDPVEWDDADAPRATAMCQALQYANGSMPELERYCQQWAPLMEDPDSAPIRYRPDGSPLYYENSYFAQGLQALFHLGQDTHLFEQTLESALEHYSTTTQTWDWTACFGVYTQAFPMRALGEGSGRSYAPTGTAITETSLEETTTEETTDEEPTSGTCTIADATVTCTAQDCRVTSDSTSGDCRTVTFASGQGDIKVLTCMKSESEHELYRQESPDGAFTVCVGDACVDELSGFDRKALACTDAPEPEPEPEPTGVAALPFSMQVDGGHTVTLDSTSGDCRTVKAETQHGGLQLLACEKPDRIEVYRQEYPSVPFTACLGTGCVDEWRGFATA